MESQGLHSSSEERGRLPGEPFQLARLNYDRGLRPPIIGPDAGAQLLRADRDVPAPAAGVKGEGAAAAKRSNRTQAPTGKRRP